MTTSSRTLLPTFVDQPIFPVPPGSVLSQLLESTNISSSRRPGMMTGTENSEKFQKSKSFCASKKSKIPTMKSAQGSDFEKSLRYYSVPGTPVSCMSRDPSPNTRCSSSRGTSPASRWGQGRSRPPPSPKSAPAKPIGPHQRPVRLAYGIHGAQYQQNQQKTPENPSPFYRQKETHSGCGSTFSGERTSRRLFSRMLPNHVVPKIERNLIPPCTPTQTEDGFILCPCQHVEIACQTISSELLSIHKKKKREEEDKDRKSVAEEEQQTDFEEANNECMICADTKKRLSKQDAKCQKLQGTVNELKAVQEIVQTRKKPNTAQIT
ncbi:uncharacterized protein LOC118436577 [Folsomia candida]|uniref:uncharacterized protein LOC118436577 n=1 Tax=Folsomia candida TaxID=158441 RepID=UPI001604ED87|nr:uncharacterized protein LOC118436577 [Folsomia candida]